MSSERRPAYPGEKFRIAFARNREGAYPAEEFFDQLSGDDKAKLMQLFRILGDHGKHTNPQKFGVLKEGLYEFKSFQIRMPYAYAQYEKGLILVTHGFLKKKDKAPPTEIARAERIIKEDAAAAQIHVINGKHSKRERP